MVICSPCMAALLGFAHSRPCLGAAFLASMGGEHLGAIIRIGPPALVLVLAWLCCSGSAQRRSTMSRNCRVP
jgi:hypothetical protein